MPHPFHHRIRRIAVAATLVLLCPLAPSPASAQVIADAPERISMGRLTMDSKLSPMPEGASTAPHAVEAATMESSPAGKPASDEPGPDESEPLMKLGPGDLVAVQVFGRPELNVSAYVGDNGTIALPLVGPVKVSGMSPAEASEQVAAALKKGDFLLNPQVNMTLQQFRSQQVSVLGEVKTPGRYPLESRTGLFDLLAQAGGLNADAAATGYLLRKDHSGVMQKIPVDLRNLSADNHGKEQSLRGGDSIYVPKSEQFYIYGEVRAPNRYRLEPGMIVLQALALGGGITERGSDSRIQIRRKLENGKFKDISAKPSDTVQADDVIRVKERIF